MVPSRGYQLFISGCKLMACGRFFPLHETVTNVEVCFAMFQSSWDLALATFRTPMTTPCKVTPWGYQSVFKVFQGPSSSVFLSSWVGQNHVEGCYGGSEGGLLHYVQEIAYFQSSSCPVSPGVIIFKDVLDSPKIERLQACEIFSQ